MRTMDAARGKWRDILRTLGADAKFLTNKHGPCPFCGGSDRYRWDDKEGSGSFFCSQCGAGNGMEFLQRLKGWDFATAAREIDKIVGNVQAQPIRKPMQTKSQRRLCADLWNAASRITVGDPVSLYFEYRRIELPQNADSLRFTTECPVPGESGRRMAMLAKVIRPDGESETIHRTFLTPQGRKADMDEPRALMPGPVTAGSAIRLAMHGERLGIAEGIETALAASKRFGVPVWAAINAGLLAKWTPPAGVTDVIVFGDNDPKYGGAFAAYSLAHRLAAREGLSVEVRIPEQVGTDWADAA